MNPERLLAHYERIVEAPDAIPRLRHFLFDLAVRGKLVPQHPTDEPASKLLMRIAAEKALLVKAGRIKPPKTLPALEKRPFALPAGWCWSQIAEIGLLSPRNEAADDRKVSFIPMPLIPAEYGVAHGQQVRAWGDIKKSYTHFAEGDVGLAKITPCFENGKSTVFHNLVGGIGGGTTELHIVRPVFVDPNYVLIFLKSPQFIESGTPKMTGTAGQKRVPFEYFAYSPFPLPPLAEQHRIVAKLGELMVLCDRLEATHTEREAIRDKLTAASLARLKAASPDTTQDDARFALDALPALTVRAGQIKQLRQIILNLAVRGKLVPQDPNDETASELLTRLNPEVSKLARKASRASASETIQPEYNLPPNWLWVRIGDHLELINGMAFKPSDWLPTGIKIVRIQNLNRADAPFNYCNPKSVRDRFLIDNGAFLISWSGTPGTSFGAFIWNRGPAVLNQHIFRCDFRLEAFEPQYLRLAINGRLDEMIARAHGGVGLQHITKGKLEALLIALPPLAEQRRIVTTVDELMAVCDKLEVCLSAVDKTRGHLLDALLADALISESYVMVEAAKQSDRAELGSAAPLQIAKL